MNSIRRLTGIRNNRKDLKDYTMGHQMQAEEYNGNIIRRDIITVGTEVLE